MKIKTIKPRGGLRTLNTSTRWYPRGLQKLVSTYKLPETQGRGSTPDQVKLKVPSYAQIFIWAGGSTPDQVKLKVPSYAQIFIWAGGSTPDQLKLKVPRSAQTFIWGDTPDQLRLKVP